MTTVNNNRIAKNTLLLYFRMLFIMAISFYTTRVVLETLGVDDFGIFNVVGGVVSMLAFFNSSMATSTQRFLNYEMGLKNESALRKVFSNSINAHLLIAVFAFVVLETAGLWFVYNKLNIPVAQHNSAIWVYQCAVISFILNIITTPYNAAIIANERMNIYAYFSVIEGILKLLIVFLLVWLPISNKLKLYAILLLIVTAIIQALYAIYCICHFNECRYEFSWDLGLIKQLFSFTGWMLFGCISNMLSTQGVSILINLFYGVVFNASRAIAVQIQQAINTFVTNFMTAVKPQIIKSYAAGEKQQMYRLVFSSSKLSYYLLFVLSLPVLLYTEYILKIWLGQVPEYCVIFTRLVLVDLLINSVYTPIAQVNQASGRIRNYQLSISTLYLLVFVITYIVYKLGSPVYSTFIISIIISFLGLFVRIYILKKEDAFPAEGYVKEVILPLVPVSLCALIIPISLYLLLDISLMTFIINVAACLACSIVCIWKLGLNIQERSFVFDQIKNVCARLKR